MGVTVVIPARGGSRRIPHKNRKKLAGVPIINYTLALARTFADMTIVSTDCPVLSELGIHAGALIHHRSPDMAENDVGTQEVVANCLREMKVPETALVVCIYPTAGPLIDGNRLRARVKLYRDYYTDWTGFAFTVGRDPLRDAGQWYIGYAKTFMENRPLVNEDSEHAILDEGTFVDVNTHKDWREMERIFKQRGENHGRKTVSAK